MTFRNFQNIETNSFGQGPTFSYGNDISNFNISVKIIFSLFPSKEFCFKTIKNKILFKRFCRHRDLLIVDWKISKNNTPKAKPKKNNGNLFYDKQGTILIKLILVNTKFDNSALTIDDID